MLRLQQKEIKMSSGKLPPYMTPSAPGLPDPVLRPLGWPAGDYTGEFVDPKIPDGLFLIKYSGPDGTWTSGPYDGSNFITYPESNIAVSVPDAGSPVFIRATSREGSHLNTINSDGMASTMDLIPYDEDEDDL
jgi:hypothetical protein